MSLQQYDILLDSGTNELEIVKFEVGVNTFGINVMKVREIIQPVDVTSVPQSHKDVEGMIKLRGEILPVISLYTFSALMPKEQKTINIS